MKVTYELACLVSEIERVKREQEIDSVLICLYYRDLLNGVAGDYEGLGYHVVTAGYREDALFLARQRSLIFLADLAMSNRRGNASRLLRLSRKGHIIFSIKRSVTLPIARSMILKLQQCLCEKSGSGEGRGCC